MRAVAPEIIIIIIFIIICFVAAIISRNVGGYMYSCVWRRDTGFVVADVSKESRLRISEQSDTALWEPQTSQPVIIQNCNA